MSTLAVDRQALQATVICTAFLFLKFVSSTFTQGGKRFAAGFRPPEDGALQPGSGPQSFDGAKKIASTSGATSSSSEAIALEKARMEENRWSRIVANDLENIPIGLVVMYGTLLSAKSPVAHIALCSAFAAFRLGHTISYANEKQPHRALCFFGGLLSILGLLVNGIIGSFS